MTGKNYGNVSIGSSLDLTLRATTAGSDCQLVVIARGNGNAAPAIINKSLSDVQKLMATSTDMVGIDPSTGSMNAMPYILHLKHVKVVESSGKFILQSPEGAHDVRLRLKRLATKLQVDWTIAETLTDAGYAIKEVKLCQVPKDFRILPATETNQWGTVYPNSVSEFIENYRLTTSADLSAGNKTVWIPANAQGISAAASSPYYRTKENAPEAASYVEIVVDNSQKNERLYYRAYLGGESSTDFNLFENTDYYWTIRINSADYRSDGRIQLLDQTPVVSTNLVPTANCLMMLPGTNICFNPYKHTSGTNGWNDYLVNNPGTASPTVNTAIASVKVLWQSKDAGMTGDLVLGYVIDNTNHQNLVNIANGGDVDQARISVKVPLTKGGNAVIAAYAADGTTILWSWHIWITDYVPVALKGEINVATRTTAIAAAQTATRNGAVQVYQGISWTDPAGSFYKCVIMDRNLGAIRAGMQNNVLDGVRTFGLLYQGGRKDPFFSTADGTTEERRTIYDGYGVQTAIAREALVTLNDLVRKPLTFSTNYTAYNASGHWNGTGPKTIYDPCPDGWRVPCNGVTVSNSASSTTDVTTKTCMTAGFGSMNTSLVYESTPPAYNNVMYYNGTSIAYINKTSPVETSTFVGSGFVYYGTSVGPAGDPVFFPGVSLREYNTGGYRTSVNNNSVFMWSSTGNAGNDGMQQKIYQIQSNLLSFRHPIAWTYGFSVRCVQDWNR